MDLYEFQNLKTEDQWDELWEKGKYAGSFTSEDLAIELYTVYGFYVEVEFDTRNGSTLGINAFEDGPRLEKYAD